MGKINILDKATINQIAAGEVVERPSSVAKELVENAIDAGASAITVEIKEGGMALLRVTDNGSGIEKEEVPTAFLRHATSKISSALDLFTVNSLGFRGEALSSICAVSQVELLTKTKEAFMGLRYVIEGGEEKSLEDVGCPTGTTFLVRNLFYNVPARKKFLKTATTESGYVNELMERMALSRPDISFKYMNNGRTILHTTGGNELKDIIYHMYGRETAMAVLPVKYAKDDYGIEISGYIGKPVLARGNRGQENYFINGRYIKCAIINQAIEDAYKSYMMGHKYPFTALHLTVPLDFVDVNVHPSKMELRFADNEAVYHAVYETIRDTLSGKNMIVSFELSQKEDRQKQQKEKLPEPLETSRRELLRNSPKESPRSAKVVVTEPLEPALPSLAAGAKPTVAQKMEVLQKVLRENNTAYGHTATSSSEQSEKIASQTQEQGNSEQISLPANLLSRDNQKEFHLIGQLFATYWLIEMDNQLFIIDQHAAHEKVLYERTMEKIRRQEKILTQSVLPPIILSLTIREADCLKRNLAVFERLGFAIEEFGGLEYKITEVPADLVAVDSKELLSEVLNILLSEREFKSADIVLERVASLSCKAAVKGNHRMSEAEAKQLIVDMLTLENPYHCPHGRPTTISMSKYELERKFKRIV